MTSWSYKEFWINNCASNNFSKCHWHLFF